MNSFIEAIMCRRKKVIHMAFSSFKQTDDTSVFDAGKVYDWLRENKIAEFIDFTDVGDGEYIELGIKAGASPETLINVALKIGQLASEAGTTEFRVYILQGRYMIRLWWE